DGAARKTRGAAASRRHCSGHSNVRSDRRRRLVPHQLHDRQRARRQQRALRRDGQTLCQRPRSQGPAAVAGLRRHARLPAGDSDDRHARSAPQQYGARPPQASTGGRRRRAAGLRGAVARALHARRQRAGNAGSVRGDCAVLRKTSDEVGGPMRRREFLEVAIALGLMEYMTRSVSSRARTRLQPKGDAAKLSRVAIMSLSFNSILKNPSQPDNPARTLDIMDLGQMYADRYGVHNIEMQHAHFPSTEPSYLKELRERFAKTKSQVTNINLEFGPQNISAADPALRQQAVDRTKEWIDHASALGCPRIMVNQGQPTQENREVAIAAL